MKDRMGYILNSQLHVEPLWNPRIATGTALLHDQIVEAFHLFSYMQLRLLIIMTLRNILTHVSIFRELALRKRE